MSEQFQRFFSVDSTKAIKAQEYGWLNAINYMSPYDSGGHGNLCVNSSAGCRALCLGLESGQAAMVSRKTGTNAVRESRKRKVEYFMKHRVEFLKEMARHIARNYAYAVRKGMKLAVRPNGATDIAWEGLHFMVDAELAAFIAARTGHDIKTGPHTLFSLFYFVQFDDYTKIARRFDRKLPTNLCLTFSRSEDNEAKAIELLNRGVNVAVVFRKALPETWRGFQVINGDKHDLRHLDPQTGVVVGLTPKGVKARRDTSGFVVD